jgi:hypothetical protein
VSVGDDRLAVFEPNGRGAGWTAVLFASDDLARLAVLFEPRVDVLVSRVHLVWRHLFPGLLVFG